MRCLKSIITVISQGKKKKSANEEQQWEQWKQKDSMVIRVETYIYVI